MQSFLTVAKKPLQSKVLLIMKLITALILFFTLNVSANGFGQEKINLKVKRTEIGGILRTIEKQTNYRFLYNNRLVDMREKVSLNIKDAAIADVLNLLLDKTRLLYQVMDNNLIVIKEDPAAPVDIVVKGKVTGDGAPLAGASIQIKGTTIGTTTDKDGNFSITAANANVTLVISSIGYDEQEIVLAGRTDISVAMVLSVKVQDAVVVIGYGTARKGDLTGSVGTIKPDDLKKTPSGALLNAVQGNIAGVQISSFGGPGDAPEINIRGIKSLYGGSVLYVVDGIFVDNIDFLSPNDIQDFQVLKDASSAAIYGYKASNGVILITTKGGKYNKDATVSYSGYYGVQRPGNVIKMANAEQFVNFATESGSSTEIASVQAAIARFGRSRINPNLPDVNTDWYKQTLRTAAPIMNHDISVDGGSEKISYSLGASYFAQDGTLDMKNSYKRYNLRAKLEAKAKDWLTVGTSVVYSKSQQYDDSSPWQDIYYAVPILPVLDQNYAGQTEYSLPYSSAKDIGYRDHQNPFPGMNNTDRLGERRRITASLFGDFHIIPKTLSFRTSLAYNSKNDNNRLMDLPYYIADAYQRTLVQSSITRSNAVEENYIFDNTLTYTKTFGDHDVTAMAGFSFRDEGYNFYSVKGFFYDGSPFTRDVKQSWYINNTSTATRVSSDAGDRVYSRSYFGRIQYKFKNRYLAYATLRNEAANKYNQERSITLPSVGLGWVVSQEDFMRSVSSINFLKIRAGWGRLANGNVPTARAQSAASTWSVFNDTKVDGFIFSTFQDNLSWEFNEELNVGINLEMLDRRLSIDADYFVKNTKNLAIPVLPQVGSETSYKNVGSMRNKGIEITATWRGKISQDFGYTVSGNFSTIKNSVTDLAGQAFISTATTAEFPQRLVVGQPVNVFYGWDITGVYQNQAEVDADPAAVAANAAGAGTVKPGYFKFRDVNGDKVLDANDRIYLGSPAPTYYYGGNVGLDYKNFDLSVRVYGQGGNIILNRNRAEVFRTSGRNIDAQLAENRWHGEGTSNSYPSSEGYRTAWNQRNSRFWLEDGKFFRVQNIQLGYTVAKNKKIPEMRFTLTADRPYVWSKTKSTNAEVGFDGIDLDTYPTPSVYTLGWNVKF